MVRGGRLALALQPRGGRLGLTQHPQQVLSGELLQVRVAPAPADQLGEKVRKLRHVLEADRHVVDPVEVAADADVVHARHLAHVLDVIGHLRQRRARARGGRPPTASICRCRSAYRGTAARSAFRSESAESSQTLNSVETNCGTNVTITTPPFFGRRARIESGTLRGWSTSARAAEWEKMTGASLTSSAWLMTAGETWDRSTSIPSRFISRTTSRPNSVRPLMPGAVERRVGPVERDVVRERHVAGAERVVGPEDAERVLDGVAAFHAEQRGEPAALNARSMSSAVSASASRSG